MIRSHDLRDLLNTPVKCLAYTTKQDQLAGEKDPNSEIAKALQRGEVTFKRGTSIVWLDAAFLMHSVRVEHNEKMPSFEIVEKPGVEVKATGFAQFSWTDSGHDCRAV